MAKVYARACESDGKNFFTVPKKLQAQVRAIIEADGYVIQEDGTVVKPVPNPAPEVEPEQEEEQTEQESVEEPNVEATEA